jgi:acyl carrier protein
MTEITRVLQAVCENPNGTIGPEDKLGAFEGWDSMRAVNFQLELESVFGVDLSDVEITGDSTVAEVEQILRSKGAHTGA